MRRFLTVALVFLFAIAALALVGCGESEKTESTETTTTQTEETGKESSDTMGTDDERAFTLEELSQYNGKNGQPAYIAVDGIVYDITGSDEWEDGEHTVCNIYSAAGQDLSEELKQSPPRMRDYVESKPVVGKLAQ